MLIAVIKIKYNSNFDLVGGDQILVELRIVSHILFKKEFQKVRNFILVDTFIVNSFSLKVTSH